MEDTVPQFLRESQAASLGRRLAGICQKMNASRRRRQMILDDKNRELEQIQKEIETINARTEHNLEIERRLMRTLHDQQEEIVTTLLYNMILIPPDENNPVSAAIQAALKEGSEIVKLHDQQERARINTLIDRGLDTNS